MKKLPAIKKTKKYNELALIPTFCDGPSAFHDGVKSLPHSSHSYGPSETRLKKCFQKMNKKLKQAVHHSLFFDVSFEKHGKEIYKNVKWPDDPLFYVSISSATDKSTAPEGCENMVLLVPVAAGLQGDTEELREHYFQLLMRRLEKHWGESLLDAVIYKKSYSVNDFVHDYNSYKGNAYGLANTLKQTAIFRPSCKSKKVNNLFYTGQLTVPGPGVPPSLISGEVVANEVIKEFGKTK